MVSYEIELDGGKDKRHAAEHVSNNLRELSKRHGIDLKVDQRHYKSGILYIDTGLAYEQFSGLVSEAASSGVPDGIRPIKIVDVKQEKDEQSEPKHNLKECRRRERSYQFELERLQGEASELRGVVEAQGKVINETKAQRESVRAELSRMRKSHEALSKRVETLASPVTDPEEILISIVRDYGSKMAELDKYKEEFDRLLGGENLAYALAFAGKSESDIRSEVLRQAGVSEAELENTDDEGVWKEYHAHNHEKYMSAARGRSILISGIKQNGIRDEEIPVAIKEILMSAEATIIEYEQKRDSFMKKDNAKKELTKAMDAHRDAKKIVEKVTSAPRDDIPVFLSSDSSTGEVRAYIPYGGGTFSDGLVNESKVAFGEGVEVKKDETLAVVSRTFGTEQFDEHVNVVYTVLKHIAPLKPLKFTVKVREMRN